MGILQVGAVAGLGLGVGLVVNTGGSKRVEQPWYYWRTLDGSQRESLHLKARKVGAATGGLVGGLAGAVAGLAMTKDPRQVALLWALGTVTGALGGALSGKVNIMDEGIGRPTERVDPSDTYPCPKNLDQLCRK